MLKIVYFPKETSSFQADLNGVPTQMSMYYSKSFGRFMLDVENLNTGEKVYGLPMNTGVDLFNACGRLGLEALVILAARREEYEATLENWSNNLIAFYMDLETYNRYFLGKDVIARQVWRQPVLRAIWQ